MQVRRNEEGKRDWVFWVLGGWIMLLAMVCLPALAHAQTLVARAADAGVAVPSREATPSLPSGSFSGVVLDTTEAAVPEAVIVLESDTASGPIRGQSGPDGAFAVEGVPQGSYRVRVERAGFDPWHGVAEARAGQHVVVGPITLELAAMHAAVEVRASGQQIAEAQVELEEHQRVLGIFPNFYAAYTPDTEPLSGRQKFSLAEHFAGDPVAFAMAGVVASSEQRANAFSGYGRGASGYLKRFGAAYTDGLTSTLLGQALLPTLLHQDPRFFVKETGSTASRALYAVASTVICKGDSRRWQLNYSNILGNFASAGISNAYYPAGQRGASLVISNALTATALGAVGGLFQEFLLHRMTPGVPAYGEVR